MARSPGNDILNTGHDSKIGDPLIQEPLDRRYAVNWSDHTETDGEYLWTETKKWYHKEKQG